MTAQQQIDKISYRGLQEISFKTSSAPAYITCRFIDPLGHGIGSSFVLSVGASSSGLNYLYSQLTGSSTVGLPVGATTLTMVSSSQVSVGFDARKDGTIDVNGSQHRVIFTGSLRLGPDVLASSSDEDTLTPQTASVQVVTTAVLRVLGASAWTGETTNGAEARLISLTNQGTTNSLYVSLVAVGASLLGAVSSTNYELMLGPGESLVRHLVPAGFDLCVVRGAGSEDVRAQEFLL